MLSCTVSNVPPCSNDALAIADFQDGDLKFNPEGRNTGLCSAVDVCLCAYCSPSVLERQAMRTYACRRSPVARHAPLVASAPCARLTSNCRVCANLH